jgi:hypothetical protein
VVGRRILGRFEGLRMGGTIELKKELPGQVVGIIDADGSTFESGVGRPGQCADRSAARSCSRRSPCSWPRAVRRLRDRGRAGQVQEAALDVMREPTTTKQTKHGHLHRRDRLPVRHLHRAGRRSATIAMYGSVAQRRRGSARCGRRLAGSIFLSFLIETVFLSIFGGLIGLGALIWPARLRHSQLPHLVGNRVHPTPRPASSGR